MRVIWEAGKLYVVKSSTDVLMFDADEPKRDAPTSNIWRTGEFVLQKRGCGSCGYALGRYKAGELMAIAQSTDGVDA